MDTLVLHPPPPGRFRFATRSGLGVTPPPQKPGTPKRYGSYCFRATCDVVDGQGCLLAEIKGYDQRPDIGSKTEEFCRLHARGMPGEPTCREASVVLISGGSMECSGQMVFVNEHGVKRLL